MKRPNLSADADWDGFLRLEERCCGLSLNLLSFDAIS
jgi:hypothetical protein